jgi:hypothetical protein
MTTPQIIVGIAAVALITAVLYVWGLRKSVGQQQDMNKKLLSACGSRVVKALKKQPAITAEQVAELIDGMTVGQAWSRSKLKVQSGKDFAPQVIEFLLDQLYIEKAGQNSYKLKK